MKTTTTRAAEKKMKAAEKAIEKALEALRDARELMSSVDSEFDGDRCDEGSECREAIEKLCRARSIVGGAIKNAHTTLAERIAAENAIKPTDVYQILDQQNARELAGW